MYAHESFIALAIKNIQKEDPSFQIPDNEHQIVMSRLLLANPRITKMDDLMFGVRQIAKAPESDFDLPLLEFCTKYEIPI